MVTINDALVAQFAELIRGMPDVQPLDFYHAWDGAAHDIAMYPELNHPQAMNFFFLACLHDLWRSLKRALDTEPELFLPQRLANLTEQEMWQNLFVGDGAPMPFPDPAKRLELTRAFGEHCAMYLTTLGDFMELHEVHEQPRPLEHFLSVLKRIPGFNLDPLQKRQRLLAMALMNRPEKFLRAAAGEQLPPIVDYHLMRLALRLGLVEITDEKMAAKNRQRAWVGAAMEYSIRRNVHKALVRVLELSGVSPDKLDFALWSARKYCPEMEPTVCDQCRFTTICAKRVDLFQPVIRTTSY